MKASRLRCCILIASLFTAAAFAGDIPAFDLNEDNVDTSHDGKWDDADTYAVPTFYIDVQARRDAKVSSGFAHAHAHVFIEGLDKATLQGLAKKAYDDLVGKIKAAGYKVLTYDDLKPDLAKLDRMQPNNRYGMPTTVTGEKTKGGEGDFVAATPSDEQAFDYSHLTGVMKPYNDLAKGKKVLVIIPQIYYAMPQVEKKKGGGWGRHKASLDMEPNMLLARAVYNGLPPDLGWCNMTVKLHDQRLAAEDVGEIATVHETKQTEHEKETDEWAVAVGDYTMKVDPAKVSTGVLSVAYTLNDRFIKLLKKAH